MNTSIEIPEPLLGAAQTAASRVGISLAEFVENAVREKVSGCGIVAPPANTAEPRWLKHFGCLKEYSEELRKIDAIIEAEFEQIDPEDWK